MQVLARWTASSTRRRQRGSMGVLKVTLRCPWRTEVLEPPELLRPPLYGSGLTSAFRAFSGYPASRKTSRTDCTQSQRPPLRSPYSGKRLGPGNLLHSELLSIHCI